MMYKLRNHFKKVVQVAEEDEYGGKYRKRYMNKRKTMGTLSTDESRINTEENEDPLKLSHKSGLTKHAVLIN